MHNEVLQEIMPRMSVAKDDRDVLANIVRRTAKIVGEGTGQ